MLQMDHLHRIASAAAPIALVCAAALSGGSDDDLAVAVPQETASSVAGRQLPTFPDAIPRDPVRQGPVTPWLASGDLVGDDVVRSRRAGRDAEPARIGVIADVVVDLRDFTVPFVVVDVDGGPRTAVAWFAGRWDTTGSTFGLDATSEEMRSRAEIEPDLLGQDRLPCRLLSSRIVGLRAVARDGTPYGVVERAVVDLARGDVAVLVVAVADRLHAVPARIASVMRTADGSAALRFDADAGTLAATQRIAPGGARLSDPRFRERVFRAVGLEPPDPNRALADGR